MKWKIYTVLYSILLLLISIGAYMRVIPTEIKSIPFYDSIGHFVLYGISGFLASKISEINFKILKIFIPIGSIAVAIIAVLEEFLQFFSSVRTFSFFDIGFGLLGILIGAIIARYNKR